MLIAQIRDRVETDGAGAEPIDVSALHGMWINSNPDSSGIARMVIPGRREPHASTSAIGRMV
jgi:hypothetical protein